MAAKVAVRAEARAAKKAAALALKAGPAMTMCAVPLRRLQRLSAKFVQMERSDWSSGTT
jgi:hypothetical protein